MPRASRGVCVCMCARCADSRGSGGGCGVDVDGVGRRCRRRVSSTSVVETRRRRRLALAAIVGRGVAMRCDAREGARDVRACVRMRMRMRMRMRLREREREAWAGARVWQPCALRLHVASRRIRRIRRCAMGARRRGGLEWSGVTARGHSPLTRRGARRPTRRISTTVVVLPVALALKGRMRAHAVMPAPSSPVSLPAVLLFVGGGTCGCEVVDVCPC
ncbi:hypothetical protein B0H11DRAFT_536343, partial [Mycena galericulata]